MNQLKPQSLDVLGVNEVLLGHCLLQTESRSKLTFFRMSLFAWTLDEMKARAAVQKAPGSPFFFLHPLLTFAECLCNTFEAKVWRWFSLCCLAHLGTTQAANLQVADPFDAEEIEEGPTSCFHLLFDSFSPLLV